MALEKDDLIVVQKSSGDQDIRKATLEQLNNFLTTGDSVQYKGAADFTDAALTPGTNGIAAPVNGDLWLNDAIGDGNWAWGANSTGEDTPDVSPGDRCIWNATENAWDLITGGGGGGGGGTITSIRQTDPITVNEDNPASPIIGLKAATQDEVGGVVGRIAKEADVAPNAGDTIPDLDEAFVTADLLSEGFVFADFSKYEEA
jgi:hypothetical protein